MARSSRRLHLSNAGQGLHVTFKTVTYRGDSGGAGGDGADGISFYLMDGAVTPGSITWDGIGAWGGSLAYTCSNTNPPHDGLVGGYLGLGIDEFGNFLNGTDLMPGYTGTNTATGDNTALGYGYKPGRIGMRGAGNVAFSVPQRPQLRPITRPRCRRPTAGAVQNTCSTGYLWNYSPCVQRRCRRRRRWPTTRPIPNAYKELPDRLSDCQRGRA